VLVLPDGRVLEESLDVMIWALGQNDQEGLLAREGDAQRQLVEGMDASFKPQLDRYKYPSRYEDEPISDHRAAGLGWINANLAPRLEKHANLFADEVAFADIAIFPFIRQFAHVDKDWFFATAPRPVCDWLKKHLSSDRFGAIMKKYPQWKSDAPGVNFPE